jgi:hypothetical protein
MVGFAQDHKNIFNTAGQTVYPNDTVFLPNRYQDSTPLLEYHPVQLNYKHQLDFLFNI